MKVTQEFEGALKNAESVPSPTTVVTYYADVKQIVYLCSSHSLKGFMSDSKPVTDWGIY